MTAETIKEQAELLGINVVSKSLRIVSEKCVNSNWVADWAAMEGQEHCQCIVGCKIKVEFSQNGHKPYPYIVDQLEYQKLVDKTKE
jgi:hypothetical protein